MSGFASGVEFSLIDKDGNKLDELSGVIELNSAEQSYTIRATDLKTGAEVSFKNNSSRNIVLRFNADSTSENQQVIFQASNVDNKHYSNEYYALSSCEVDKNPQNRPTRSFFIINSNEIKWLKFSLRNCETGTIEKDGKITLDTKLLETTTNINDNSVSPIVPIGPTPPRGLPAVIIGQETVRDLSAGNGQLLCQRDDIDTLKLYDGSGNEIHDFKPKLASGKQGTEITFTIKNQTGTNYQKMHFELKCKSGVKQQYYFDARPKEIRVSGIPKDGWLYAEQRYKSDDGTAYDDGFSNAIKQQGSLANCDNCKVVANKLEAKTMNAITLSPVDANGKIVEDYNSISEIVIAGKRYSDGTSGSKNEKNGNILTRPCVAGSRAGCEIALAEISGAKSEIYTDIDIVNKIKVLAYNNVGPTVLYGVDTDWTKYSQSQATPLCNKSESHDYIKMVNGTPLIGCNIPFVAEDGSDELNFYTFKPAVYKLLFEGKNSPENDSYGINNLTYIHTIKADDYDAAKNEIFEAADFNASILAIGASLDSLNNNRTLSHYDNHLKVADKLIFSGNPANPTITISGSKTNDIADDFIVTASNDKTDISSALTLTLEPNDPYDHKNGYKASHMSAEITTDKNNITIKMPKDDFYAGKNTKVNKLNFKREDLLARSYVHIGKSSVDIDMSNSKNADLNTKITNEKAAFISSYKGDDLNFVDAAIIAPNLASSEDTTDGAVYLAGYCESTSRTACKESKVFTTNSIAGHINYFGFASPNKEITAKGLFNYDGANFAQFKRGADFLSSFTADEVKIELKGTKAKEYCEIFRNCHVLGSKFGTTFNSYKASNIQWHGDGDAQAETIVDSINEGNKQTRRKEQRLSF